MRWQSTPTATPLTALPSTRNAKYVAGKNKSHVVTRPGLYIGPTVKAGIAWVSPLTKVNPYKLIATGRLRLARKDPPHTVMMLTNTITTGVRGQLATSIKPYSTLGTYQALKLQILVQLVGAYQLLTEIALK